MKKALLVGAGAVLIGTAGAAATTSAMSGSGSWFGHFGYSDKFDADLAGSLATRFDLNKDDVAQVIEQVRDDQFNVLDDKQTAKLQKALDDDRITQQQYDTIEQKLTAIDGLIDRIDDEQGTARKQTASDIKSAYKDLYKWLNDEHISASIIVHAPFGHGHFHYRHYSHHGHRH
jgi:hypothetical protein